MGVVITTVSAQRNRTMSVFQPAAIATYKMGNRSTKQVTEAAITQTRITVQKELLGNNTGVSREDVLLEIHNNRSIIRYSDQQLWQQPSEQKQQESSGKYMHLDTNQILG
jgi:hypothetical protein